MHTTTQIRRPIHLVAALAYLGVSVLAPQARADAPPIVIGPEPAYPCPRNPGCTFNVSTQMGAFSANKQPGGKAVASGRFDYDSAYRVTTSVARVADVCNSKGTGDGLVAYFYIDMRGTRGEVYNLIRRPTKFIDDNGCNTGPKISGYLFLDTRSMGVRVKQVRARVCVGDPRDGGTTFSCTTGNWKDNPFT